MPLQFVTHIALAEDVQLPIRIILMNPPHGIDERDEILLRLQTADGQYRLLALGSGLYLGIQSLRIQGVLDNRDLLLQEFWIESLDLLRLHDDLIRTLIQQAAYGEGELGMLAQRIVAIADDDSLPIEETGGEHQKIASAQERNGDIGFPGPHITTKVEEILDGAKTLLVVIEFHHGDTGWNLIELGTLFQRDNGDVITHCRECRREAYKNLLGTASGKTADVEINPHCVSRSSYAQALRACRMAWIFASLPQTALESYGRSGKAPYFSAIA